MTVAELVDLIKKSTQHKTLYHFTDEANFASIRQHGLLSKVQLVAKGLWPPPVPGGNQLSWDLDRACGIETSVSLCMTRNHPMCFVAQREGRLANPRYLAIKAEVLHTLGTRVSFGIANANDANILDIADAVDLLDTDVLYTRTDWRDPAIYGRLCTAEKFEVLVPDAVSCDLIAGVY